MLLGKFNAQGFEDLLQQAVRRVCVTNNYNNNNNDNNTNINIVHDRCDLEIWERVTPNIEYVKLVVFRGRVQGAVLIGDTDMEETVENLILDRIDVSSLGVQMLDPEIDIADYFD